MQDRFLFLVFFFFKSLIFIQIQKGDCVRVAIVADVDIHVATVHHRRVGRRLRARRLRHRRLRRLLRLRFGAVVYFRGE